MEHNICVSLIFPNFTNLTARILDIPKNCNTVQKYTESLQKALKRQSKESGQHFDAAGLSCNTMDAAEVSEKAIITANKRINMNISFDSCSKCIKKNRKCLSCLQPSAVAARDVFMKIYYENQK